MITNNGFSFSPFPQPWSWSPSTGCAWTTGDIIIKDIMVKGEDMGCAEEVKMEYVWQGFLIDRTQGFSSATSLGFTVADDEDAALSFFSEGLAVSLGDVLNGRFDLVVTEVAEVAARPVKPVKGG